VSREGLEGASSEKVMVCVTSRGNAKSARIRIAASAGRFGQRLVRGSVENAAERPWG